MSDLSFNSCFLQKQQTPIGAVTLHINVTTDKALVQSEKLTALAISQKSCARAVALPFALNFFKTLRSLSKCLERCSILRLFQDRLFYGKVFFKTENSTHRRLWIFVSRWVKNDSIQSAKLTARLRSRSGLTSDNLSGARAQTK